MRATDVRIALGIEALPASVGVIAIAHSDDTDYSGLIDSIGDCANAWVAVSEYLLQRLQAFHPEPAQPLRRIPYAVPIPELRPPRPPRQGPLRVAYVGRLAQLQKRVLDLPMIARALVVRGVSVRWSVAGSGPEEGELHAAWSEGRERREVGFLGRINEAGVRELLANSDVLVLPSEFEGQPIALIEAMAAGCVPVVSDLASGIPELIASGQEGYRVPVGDIDGFASCIAALDRDRALLGQSLLVVMPHIISLVAITAICFAVSYTVFMPQEIRSL